MSSNEEGNPSDHEEQEEQIGYHDDHKMQQSIKLLSNLEQKAEFSDWTISDNLPLVYDDNQKSSTLMTISKFVKKRVFQINHVILKNQSVTIYLYHLIMLFEFLQILFFIFYKVEIYSEVSDQPPVSSANGSLTSITQPSQNSFTIDYYFTFINFQMYTLQSTSMSTFILVYAALSGVFFLLLVFLFMLSSQAFEESMVEEIKENSKVAIRILTIVVSLFLFLLQIPFITILLQGYLCDEDPSEIYIVPGIACNGITHTILCLFSTITLTFYSAFLLIEKQLFASNNFESTLPWSSIERRVISIRVLYKLVMAAGFIFDKKAIYKGQIGLVCFCLCALLVVKRFMSALIFKKSVFYASIFYEVLTMWLFLIISLQTFAGTRFTYFTLSLSVLAGVNIAFALILIQDCKRTRAIEEANIEKFKTPLQFEKYFYRIYEIIESKAPEDRILMFGLLFEHVNFCDEIDCPCKDIAESIDGIKRYQKQKKQQLEMQKEQTRNDFDTCYQLPPTRLIIANEEPTTPSRRIGAPSFKSSLNISSGNDGGVISRKKLSRAPTLKSSQKIKDSTQSAVPDIIKKVQTQESSISKISANQKRVQYQNQYKSVNSIARANFFKQSSNINEQSNNEHGLEFTSVEHIKEKKRWYKFFTVLIKHSMDMFPDDVYLKIISSFVYKSKLHNEYKAIFELMTCEDHRISFQDEFIIFRRKIEIEQIFIQLHFKSVQRIGQIDILQAYNYEKYFLRFKMYEYLTVYTCQNFWSELLSKNINASTLQQHGEEISKNHQNIQDVAKKLQEIYPNDMKFLYRYGIFLLHILNNEFDAIAYLEKVYSTYQNKVCKKSHIIQNSETSSFGENSSSGILVISATSTRFGEVIHVNDELEHVLGYQRQDVLGRNISMICPRPIEKIHDKFIVRYFETAKPTVIDIKRQIFAKCKNGYIREVELIAKVYPHINGKILFIGFIKRAPSFDGMESAKNEFENLEQQYIITDQDGNITNITEGLNLDLGLNQKFFDYSDSIFQQMFSITKICKDILDTDIMEALEYEGKILTIDTRSILNSIELEQMTAQQILEIKSNLTKTKVFVQLKRLVFDPKFCIVHLYRLLIMPKHGFHFTAAASSNMLQYKSMEQYNSGSINATDSERNTQSTLSQNNQLSVGASSVSSATSSSFQFNRVFQDFKKSLSERTIPRHLIILNRFMIALLLTTIAMTSTSYVIEQNQISNFEQKNMIQLMSECRNIQTVQLASNVRSFINIANGLEFGQYESGTLQSVDRFQYLSQLIQQQAAQLQSTHEYLIEDRGDQSLSDYEYQQINLYRLIAGNRVDGYSLPYRVALTTYLNDILVLNVTNKGSLNLTPELLLSVPNLQIPSPRPNSTSNFTLMQQTNYFILANGMRSLRTMTSDATLFEEHLIQSSSISAEFMVIMVFGIIISVFYTIAVLYQIWTVEIQKGEILSLYALLSTPEISKVYKKCMEYLGHLDLSHSVHCNQTEVEEEEDFQEIVRHEEEQKNHGFIKKVTIAVGSQMNFSQSHNHFKLDGSLASSINGLGAVGSRYFGNTQQSLEGINEDEESEEEKEAKTYQKYLVKKKQRKVRENQEQRSKDHGLQFGMEMFSSMAKNSMEQLKSVNEKEEQMRQLFYKRRQTLKYGESPKHHRHAEPAEIKTSPKTHKGGIQRRSSIKSVRVKKAEEEKSSESSNEEEKMEEEAPSPRKEKKKKSEANVVSPRKMVPVSEFSVQEERKTAFQKTIKFSNWGLMILNSILGLVFVAYFIQTYILNNVLENQLSQYQQNVPLFFDRYRNLMLSFAFMRERIINNNSLDSYELDPTYGHNLDQLYISQSGSVEAQLISLKTAHPLILDPLISLTLTCDSLEFCSKIIAGINSSSGYNNNSTLSSGASLVQLQSTYQNLISTVIQAIQASATGNIALLQQLAGEGVNLNQGDYDLKTPLHIAVLYGNIDIVKYLLSMMVSINPFDRWNATPLNYAVFGSQVYTYLITQGAQLGSNQPNLSLLPTTLFNNDYEQFFAAFYDNVDALTALQAAGQNVNVQDLEGRTALHVAASQGNLNAVQYLISQGADLSFVDSRGNTPMSDAVRQSRANVISYINSFNSDEVIMNYCSSFASGILKQGVQQAIGNFRKRFSDLQMIVNETSNTSSILLPDTSQAQQDYFDTIQTYFSAQELYFHRIIDLYVTTMTSNFANSTNQYLQIVQIVFLVFLAIQIIILFLFRARLMMVLREDIFQSRGILNLIPDDFFENNRASVEGLIKKLRT